jgi:ABC-type uncharacterized transport system auxiliary subunit
MKTSAFKFAISLAGALLLSACVLGGDEKPYRLIAPRIEPPETAAASRIDTMLAVARARADRTRDSSRILVRRDRTLLPWSGAAWIDRAPDLLRDLLIEYLEGRIATVGAYGELPATERLDLVLRRFEFAEREGGRLRAEVEVVARLFSAEGELIDSTVLSGRQETQGESIEAALPAMEAALGAVFSDLADWLAARLGAEPGPSGQ